MDTDELRTVRRTEREKDSLQHLRDSFYEDVAVFLADLKAQRDRAAERAEDPFASDEVRQLTDQIETAKEVSEAVYERRVGKVVKLASFAAADMSVETAGMTDQEHELFTDLVGRIKQNKSTVLDILAGEHDPAAAAEAAAKPSEAAPSTAAPTPDAGTPETSERDAPAPQNPAAEADSAGGTADAGGMLADAMGGDTDPTPTEAAADGEAPEESPDPPADAPPETPVAAAPDATADGSTEGHTPVDPDPEPPGAGEGSPDGTPNTDGGTATATPDTERTTVRITRDVGQILGTDDREYDLSSEDVVTLPATNAEPLVRKDAAEKLE
jgi:DNA replication factor GINS